MGNGESGPYTAPHFIWRWGRLSVRCLLLHGRWSYLYDDQNDNTHRITDPETVQTVEAARQRADREKWEQLTEAYAAGEI